MRELTARQQQVLTFIRKFTEKHGLPPTVREIGERFGFTARAAFDHLRALERKGMLHRRQSDRRTSRTLGVKPSSAASRASDQEIPILGRIAAGQPIEAVEDREGILPVLADWFAGRGTELFALRVRGESMIDAHIADGDLVVVRRQAAAQPGDIVAAMIDGEATVKRFARSGGAVVLKPEHPTMRPIVVEAGQGDVQILGKVVGVVRSL